MKEAEIMDRLLTAEEAARYMDLQVSTVRRLCYEKRLPVVRPTGRRCVRFRMSDLERLLRARSEPMRGELGCRRPRPSPTHGQAEAA